MVHGPEQHPPHPEPRPVPSTWETPEQVAARFAASNAALNPPPTVTPPEDAVPMVVDVCPHGHRDPCPACDPFTDRWDQPTL